MRFRIALDQTPKRREYASMNSSPDVPGPPPELEDALARINQAKENYVSLADELDRFL